MSIRPNPGPGNNLIGSTPNGRLTVTGATARALILRAYGMHDVQVLGAPEWTASERFDIAARVQPPPEGGPDALMPMLRTLLVDRFRLKAHEETREMSAYVLIRVRSDRPLGPQIRPTQADCTRTTPVTQAEISAGLKDGWPPCGGLKLEEKRTAVPVLVIDSVERPTEN